MIFSYNKQRYSVKKVDPLPNLLIMLLGNYSEYKLDPILLSKCIRICILVDQIDSSNLIYQPFYYMSTNKLRESLFKDLEREELIFYKSNFFTYSYTIRNYNKHYEILDCIKDHLRKDIFDLRLDTLILCIIYLKKDGIVDNKNKVYKIIKHYRDKKEIKELVRMVMWKLEMSKLNYL